MFEQVITVTIPAGAGSSNIDEVTINRDATGTPLMLEAWSGANQPSNVYLIRGRGWTVAEILAMVAGNTSGSDLLMVIAGGHSARRRLPDDVTDLTIFTETAPGAGKSQATTVRVYDGS